MFNEDLKSRKAALEKLLVHIQKVLRSSPEGTLRISSSNGVVQYYHRVSPDDRSGRYISKKNIALAATLAQKEYYERLSETIKKELHAIGLYLSEKPETPAEEVYDHMTAERKKLVKPALITDEMYKKTWAECTYDKKEFKEDAPVFLTERGERVRSKSEIIIANMLEKEKIPYRYECALHLNGFATIHPDFTVLNVRERKEIYWEHFGMMDNADYAIQAINRISGYIKNGYLPGRDVIMTFETVRNPLDVRDIKVLIRDIK